MIRKALCIVCFLCLSIVAVARNGFLVAPTHLDLDCARPHTASFVVTNTGDQTIHIRISPECFTTGSASLKLGTDLFPKNAKRVCVSDYMLVSPRAVSLTPGAKRTVRISIRPPADLAPGGYRAHLLFSMLENANTYNQNAVGKDGRNMNMKLNVLFEMAVGIYCKKGEGDAKLTAKCLTNDNKLQISMRNTTPWRYKGKLELRKKGSDKIAQSLPIIILRQSQQVVPTDLTKKSKAQYIVKWLPKDGYKDKGEITC